jgi:phage head maturation protease
MQRLSLETGDMQMSFGFIPRKVEYDEDANTVRILEAELLEVSPVIWPAYSASSAGPAARSIDQAEVDSPEIEKISEEIESPSVDNNELLRESYLQYFAHIAPKPHE